MATMIATRMAWSLERSDRRLTFAADDRLAAFAESTPAAAADHRQPAWKLVLCPDGVVDLRRPGRPTLWAPGTVVPPGTSNRGGASGPYVALFLDPWRVRLPPGAGPIPLDAPAVRRIVAGLDVDGGLDLDGGRRALAEVLGSEPEVDPRLTYVLGRLGDADQLEPLAGEVGLSPPRLRALVRESVGFSLGQLRRWARLRAAVAALSDGSPPADAAHRAGFADQPHLTRTARDLIGRTPGEIVRGPAGGAYGR